MPNYIQVGDSFVKTAEKIDPGVRSYEMKFNIGTDIEVCPACKGPMSYRNGSPFCRCGMRPGKLPDGKSKGKGRLRR